jgi:hypothetical protein
MPGRPASLRRRVTRNVSDHRSSRPPPQSLLSVRLVRQSPRQAHVQQPDHRHRDEQHQDHQNPGQTGPQPLAYEWDDGSHRPAPLRRTRPRRTKGARRCRDRTSRASTASPAPPSAPRPPTTPHKGGVGFRQVGSAKLSESLSSRACDGSRLPGPCDDNRHESGWRHHEAQSGPGSTRPHRWAIAAASPRFRTCSFSRMCVT